MMLAVPDLLDTEGVARVRAIVDAGDWMDGNATSGHQSALAKRNMQLPRTARRRARRADRARRARPVASVHRRGAAAQDLPAPVQPLPGRRGVRHPYRQCGPHPPRQASSGCAATCRRRSSSRIRTAYDGGELVVEDKLGAHAVKLPAGHLLLYPASSLHRVEPVTRGARVACFFWIQSMVRDDRRARDPVRSRPVDPGGRRRSRPGATARSSG